MFKMKIEEDIEILSISSDDDDDLPLKTKTYNGSDDEDDLPLKIKSYNQADNEDFTNLYEESWEKCEFCDLVFHNKYDILVHTGRHIIIPLIKQELYQCSECLFHFKSTQELRVHALKKHCETTRISNNVSLVKCEAIIENNHTLPHDVTSLKIHNLLESFVKREPLVKCDDLGFLSLNTSNTGLKSRLIFEDDLVPDDDLLTDLTTDCKVNIEMFEVPWFAHREKVQNLSVEPGLLSQEYKSVHYDELMLPGEYDCKSCKMSFPCRYELVIHETNHMTMRGRKRSYLPPLCPVCERYISGNYRNLQQHIEKKHTTTPIRKHTTHHCKKCGLKYINYGRHIINYHQLYKCYRCGKGYEDEMERTKHAEDCNCLDWDYRDNGKWESRIVKICDLCYSFTKNKQNYQYVDMGDFSELGKRQTCDHCFNTFFELKMIKLWRKQRIQKVEKRKGPSCQDRLMQKLKMMKKKYKYYICCFIFD